MHISGPQRGASGAVERILRSLPAWFGIEASLLEYVADAERYPTFLAVGPQPLAFVTVRAHFETSWEVHCMAVDARHRGQGVGRVLHQHVESWLAGQGARLLQVKTLSASHPSAEYAETRRFYAAMGYTPLEEFPTLWGSRLPVLQLIKPIHAEALASSG